MRRDKRQGLLDRSAEPNPQATLIVFADQRLVSESNSRTEQVLTENYSAYVKPHVRLIKSLSDRRLDLGQNGRLVDKKSFPLLHVMLTLGRKHAHPLKNMQFPSLIS